MPRLGFLSLASTEFIGGLPCSRVMWRRRDAARRRSEARRRRGDDCSRWHQARLAAKLDGGGFVVPVQRSGRSSM